VTTRLALAGYGWMAAHHVEAFRALGVETIAACNRSERGRRRAREEGAIASTYESATEMVEREGPDAVLVTASVLSQFELTRELIPLGIPLLVEKPPGTSAAEADELASLAAHHRTPVMVALNRRFYSVLRRALARVGGREAVTRVEVEWSEDPENMVRLGHPSEIVPRLVFANSLHGLDLLTLFAGRLGRVTVTGDNLDPAGTAPRWQMAAHGIGETGVAASFRSTWTEAVPWRLSFATASAHVVSAPLETAVIHHDGGVFETIDPDEEDRRLKPGLLGQARAFLEVVRERTVRWPACSLDESRAAMDLAEALTRACQAAGQV
jgi:predicted dehydrogenase